MLRFASGEELQTKEILGKHMIIRGALRESLEIHLADGVTYEQLNRLFVDGAQFSVTETVLDEETGLTSENEYPKPEYIMCGSITDNRDGSFMVSMGTITENERLANENAELILSLIGEV